MSKKDHVKSILNGTVIAFVGVAAYIFVFFMEFLQAPFIELFGNNYGSDKKIFFITLNLLVAVISKYFNIAKEVCTTDINDITKNFERLEQIFRFKTYKVPTLINAPILIKPPNVIAQRTMRNRAWQAGTGAGAGAGAGAGSNTPSV